MHKIDELLNRITMYRLVVYVLTGYVALALVFTFMGKLAFTPTAMIGSLALLLGSAFVVDKGFSHLFRVPTNSESWLITALILFLIVQPADSASTALVLALAGAVSSASKFLITWKNKHIFNPAALAAALLSLTAIGATTWWIGSSIFWPFTLLCGLAIVRKIRRMPLFVTFFAVSTVLQVVLFILNNQPLAVGVKGMLIASPLLFLGTIMLTEPATMPPRRNQQVIFAAMTAVLYVTAWGVGPFYIYPEVALLLANIYAFAVSPKLRVALRLHEIQRISDRVYNYVFQPDRPFSFLPGQYMEWTLAGVPYDSRGNRRSFTIASSPTEDTVQVGIKYYEPASAYKVTFGSMGIGDVIHASQLAGNFTVDPDSKSKLAFIAGGIGITPFRSMVKYFTDTNTARDIVLLYVVSDPAELAYVQEFTEASRVGVRFVPIVTRQDYSAPGVVSGRLSEELLAHLVPDFHDRIFYISGPSNMVDGAKRYLHNMQVSLNDIKTDHFSGY